MKEEAFKDFVPLASRTVHTGGHGAYLISYLLQIQMTGAQQLAKCKIDFILKHYTQNEVMTLFFFKEKHLQRVFAFVSRMNHLNSVADTYLLCQLNNKRAHRGQNQRIVFFLHEG